MVWDGFIHVSVGCQAGSHSERQLEFLIFATCFSMWHLWFVHMVDLRFQEKTSPSEQAPFKSVCVLLLITHQILQDIRPLASVYMCTSATTLGTIESYPKFWCYQCLPSQLPPLFFSTRYKIMFRKAIPHISTNASVSFSATYLAPTGECYSADTRWISIEWMNL